MQSQVWKLSGKGTVLSSFGTLFVRGRNWPIDWSMRIGKLPGMKHGWIFVLAWICFAGTVLAQRTTVLDQLGQAAEQWARENMDENVLKALETVDPGQAESLLADLNRSLKGESVYDMVRLKGTATALLPHLQKYEGTRPYASWLQAHLDYLDAAEQLRKRNQTQPGVPPANPTPDQQKTVWDKQLEKRPMPPRAQTYVPRLKPIFISQGAPAELVWLGEIESSFDPSARSPAGAVGLYQLMPATAKSLGLSLSPRDERLEAEKNSRAAAKYLRYLYNRFGDWRLALAAYNAGETRVNKLLTQYRTRSYSAIASKLPAETQMYVPKFEATLQKREGIPVTSLRLPAAS